MNCSCTEPVKLSSYNWPCTIFRKRLKATKAVQDDFISYKERLGLLGRSINLSVCSDIV